MTRSNARPLCDSRATCFMLIFAVFLPDFIFLEHNGQIHPSFIKIVHLFDPSPHKTRTFTMRLAATTTTKERFCGRDAGVCDAHIRNKFTHSTSVSQYLLYLQCAVARQRPLYCRRFATYAGAVPSGYHNVVFQAH